MTRTLLIRHAEVDTAGRLCGSLDVPLSAAGRAEVEQRLRPPPTRPVPDVLYSSTLARAIDVAGALSRAWRLGPRAADWAREIDCGHFEGMSFDHVQRHFPDIWARNETQEDEHFCWPGGETYLAFRARVMAGLASLVQAHAGARVALVTHAGVVSQVMGAMRGRSAALWSLDRPAPLTATEIAWDGTTPVAVLTFNEANWF